MSATRRSFLALIGLAPFAPKAVLATPSRSLGIARRWFTPVSERVSVRMVGGGGGGYGGSLRSAASALNLDHLEADIASILAAEFPGISAMQAAHEDRSYMQIGPVRTPVDDRDPEAATAGECDPAWGDRAGMVLFLVALALSPAVGIAIAVIWWVRP